MTADHTPTRLRDLVTELDDTHRAARAADEAAAEQWRIYVELLHDAMVARAAYHRAVYRYEQHRRGVEP